jgi:hypothetical protein
VVVVLCVLALWVPAMIAAFTEMHAASSAFERYGQALVAKDYERAYSLTNTEFQTAMTRQEFIDQQKSLSARYGDLNKVVSTNVETKENTDGWSSTIESKFIYAKDESDFTFAMKKDRGNWLVYGYKEHMKPGPN